MVNLRCHGMVFFSEPEVPDLPGGQENGRFFFGKNHRKTMGKGDGTDETQRKNAGSGAIFSPPLTPKEAAIWRKSLFKATDSLQHSIGSLPKSSKDCLGLRFCFFPSFFRQSWKKYLFSGDQVALVGPGDVWVGVTVEFSCLATWSVH